LVFKNLQTILITAFLAFFCHSAQAVPPEGLEGFSILGNGKPKEASFYSNVGYVNPSFTSDYETFQVYGGTLTPLKNYISAGGSMTVGNKFGDRAAYFARYDWTFWRSSFGIKWAHEDYRYINAGKNSIGLDFNSSIGVTKKSGAYISIGVFDRWINYRWNQPSWSPINFGGEDHQANLQGCLGIFVGEFLGTSFTTLDVNTKDVFSYYNLDNVGIDTTFNWGEGNRFFRLTAGARFSGVSGVTSDYSDVHVLLGLVY